MCETRGPLGPGPAERQVMATRDWSCIRRGAEVAEAEAEAPKSLIDERRSHLHLQEKL